MTSTRPGTGAGWFPDPYDARYIRYWDGTQWTEHFQLTPTAIGPASAPSPPALVARTSGTRAWWQTWWVIIPGLVLCFPVGLIGLWLRQGTSNLVKGGVTLGVALLLVATALSGGADGTDDRSVDAGQSLTQASPKATPSPTHKPAPQRARVPALRGMTVTDARAELRVQHLKVAAIERRPSALPAGTVLSQSYRSGKQLGWGTAVALVVASPLPRVPSVVGQGEAAAVQVVKNAGFRVNVTHQTVTSGADGVVISISPPRGTSLRPNSTITIVVSHLVRPVVAAPSPKPPTSSSNCTPGYSPCLPPASDYDCAGGSGDGPKYTGFVRVTGSDPYGLDADGDGYGCD